MFKKETGYKGFILMLLLTFFIATIDANGTILTTKHNLSATGPGPVRAITETQVCVFCHTPHRAILDTPLWNRTLSSALYQLYESPTLLSPTSPVIQPDGDSKLCLSCHDGTVAIGSVVNIGGSPSTISMQGTGPGGVMPPSGSGYIGTDLSGHHPVSIEMNASLLNDKMTQCTDGIVTWKLCFPTAPVKLRPTNNRYGTSTPPRVGVQCTSCHDPHRDPDPPDTVFLRIGDRNRTDQLCLKCHADCFASCP